jgi:hypothetical protein
MCAALLVLGLLSAAPAQGIDASARDVEVFVAVNPAAALYGAVEGPAAYVYPFVTGHEYGVALSAGVNLFAHSRLELRFSAGAPNAVSHHTQLHVGYAFRLLEFLGLQSQGLYLGLFARFTDNSQRGPRVHYYSFVPYAVLGYWLPIGRFFLDLRFEQTFLAVTVSDAPHTGVGVAPLTSPLPGLSPVLPAMVLNLGLAL